VSKGEEAISSVYKEAGLEVVAHKIQNLGTVVICLNTHATSGAVTEAIRVDLQEGSSGEAANGAKLKLEVDRSGHSLVGIRFVAIVVTVCTFPFDVMVSGLSPLAL